MTQHLRKFTKPLTMVLPTSTKKSSKCKSSQHKTRLIPKALCLSLALLTGSQAIAADLNLPDIGTAAAGTLTIAQENRYGDAYIRVLRSKLPMLSDPVMNTYINQLGHTLSANARDVRTPFYFSWFVIHKLMHLLFWRACCRQYRLIFICRK